jgi:hypothetical protein
MGKTQLAWCGCNFCLMADVYRKKGNSQDRERDTLRVWTIVSETEG